MNIPKMIPFEEQQKEVEILADHISCLIQEGKITDGAAVVAVVKALMKQEWLPRSFVEARVSILARASMELGRVSEQVLRDAGRRP